MKSTQQWSIGGTTFKFSNICVVCLFSRAQRNCQSLAVCHDDNLTTWLMGMGIVALGTVQNSCCGYVRCCCCCCDSLRDEKGILTVLSNNSWMEKLKSLHICCCFCLFSKWDMIACIWLVFVWLIRFDSSNTKQDAWAASTMSFLYADFNMFQVSILLTDRSEYKPGNIYRRWLAFLSKKDI